MKAITITTLFVAAMAMSNISSAATAQEPSLKTAHMGMELNNDEEDDRMSFTVYPPIGWDWWKPMFPR